MFIFENLKIWHSSVELVDYLYSTTDNFPSHELYAMTSQIRRAGISVSANIAEGSASSSNRAFRNFLNYSIRSLAEVVSILSIAHRRRYISQEEYKQLYSFSEGLIKQITSFRNSLTYK